MLNAMTSYLMIFDGANFWCRQNFNFLKKRIWGETTVRCLILVGDDVIVYRGITRGLVWFIGPQCTWRGLSGRVVRWCRPRICLGPRSKSWRRSHLTRRWWPNLKYITYKGYWSFCWGSSLRKKKPWTFAFVNIFLEMCRLLTQYTNTWC